MKRLLALAAMLALSVSIAHAAGMCGKHLTNQPITFRTTQPNSTSFADSSVFRESTGQNADTTAAIPTYLFETPPIAGIPTGTAVDTVLMGIVSVSPTANSALTAGADSFYVAQQVSIDGSNWITITQTTLARTCMQGTDKCAAMLEMGASINGFNYPVRLALKATTATGYGVLYPIVIGSETTAPSCVQWFGWRYMRFIIQGDETGEYQATLSYWSTDC